jgi:hypothetical protein
MANTSYPPLYQINTRIWLKELSRTLGHRATLDAISDLENHDEPQAAATFPFEVHEAAAVVTYLAPGLRFFHQGPFEGRGKLISPHLCRGPDEPINPTLQAVLSPLARCAAPARRAAGAWATARVSSCLGGQLDLGLLFRRRSLAAACCSWP